MTLLVTVLGEGAPLAGARVSLGQEYFAVTDSRGEAQIQVSTAGEWANVTADGYASSPVTRPRDGSRQTVVLERGAIFGALVIGSDGILVADAIVSIKAPYRGAQVKTSADGAWKHRAGSGRFEITATSATEIASPKILFEHDGVSERPDLVINTVAAATLAARVVDRTGAPVTDAVVHLNDFHRSELPREWRTDGEGRIEAKAISPGVFSVYASTSDGASDISMITLVRGELTQLSLVIEPERAIAGTVVDHAGTPLANVNVSCIGRSSVQSSVQVHVGTDDTGHFHLGGLPSIDPGTGFGDRSDSYFVSAHYRGEHGRIDVRPGVTNVVIALRRRARVTGRVLFEGVPMPYFGIAIDRGRFPTIFRDGQFDFSFNGAATLNIWGPGSARRLVEVAKQEAGTVMDLGDIVLERGQYISGRVIDDNGSPVVNARVIIEPLANVTWTTRPLWNEFCDQFEAITDANGGYMFAGIGLRRDRPVVVKAHHSQYGVSIARAVPEGDATDIELVLSPAGGIDVHFTHSKEDFRLRAQRVDAELDQHFDDIEDGVAMLLDVPVGVYRVTASDHGKDISSTEIVEVVGGKRAVVRLTELNTSS